MNSYTYVEATNVNLLCCICRLPFFEPLTTRTCWHTFCRACISKALSLSSHCPIDRSSLRLDDLSPADPLVRNIVDELDVECPNRAEGCSVICQRQLVQSHIRDSCLYTKVPCQEGLCENMFPRKNAEHSAHGPIEDSIDSPQSTTECNSCHAQVIRAELSVHQTSCSEILVSCTQAPNGCGWSGTREQLFTSHQPNCPYESIKGFFVLHERQMSKVTEENVALRHRVTALDGIVTSLQRELAAVKAALGPWYKPDRRTQQQSYPDAALGSQGSTRITHLEILDTTSGPTIISARSPPASSAIHAEGIDLSSYFPPADDEDTIQEGDFLYDSASQPYSSATLASRLTNQVVSSTSPPQSPIAPLDISTTLEGSLCGLRDSIVTLSSALDSLGRRQDVALSAETLRTSEEIRSIRAVIHGLRMQVHSIMMDRNAQATGRAGEESTILTPPWLPDMHVREGPPPWLHVPYPARYPHPSIPPPTGSIPKL